MQFESEDPAHGTFSPLRNALENLVHVDALVFADPQRRTVNEIDACTLTQQYVLDEDGKRYGDFFFKFHETVVRHKLWKPLAILFGLTFF